MTSLEWFASIPEQFRKRPEFGFVEDLPGLPRALLIGDSISMSYTIPVRRLLEGVANLHRAPDNCRSTRQTLERLEGYLGSGNWDLIHFNFGIHDITWMGPDGATDIGSGSRQVSLEQYRENLEKIVARLSATGAKLIWASTTPVQPGTQFRDPEDVLVYNAAAAEIMDRTGVPINDLYSLALPRLRELQPLLNVHFTEAGAEVLAAQMANCIQDRLQDR